MVWSILELTMLATVFGLLALEGAAAVATDPQNGRLLRTDLFGSDEDYGMESEFTDEFRESTGQRSGNLRARGEARRSRFGADDNGEFRFGKY